MRTAAYRPVQRGLVPVRIQGPPIWATTTLRSPPTVPGPGPSSQASTTGPRSLRIQQPAADPPTTGRRHLRRRVRPRRGRLRRHVVMGHMGRRSRRAHTPSRLPHAQQHGKGIRPPGDPVGRGYGNRRHLPPPGAQLSTRPLAVQRMAATRPSSSNYATEPKPQRPADNRERHDANLGPELSEALILATFASGTRFWATTWDKDARAFTPPHAPKGSPLRRREFSVWEVRLGQFLRLRHLPEMAFYQHFLVPRPLAGAGRSDSFAHGSRTARLPNHCRPVAVASQGGSSAPLGFPTRRT